MTFNRATAYQQLIEEGIPHEEADIIANLDDEEIIQFVIDCDNDIECLPKEMQAYYLTIVS